MSFFDPTSPPPAAAWHQMTVFSTSDEYPPSLFLYSSLSAACLFSPVSLQSPSASSFFYPFSFVIRVSQPVPCPPPPSAYTHMSGSEGQKLAGTGPGYLAVNVDGGAGAPPSPLLSVSVSGPSTPHRLESSFPQTAHLVLYTPDARA